MRASDDGGERCQEFVEGDEIPKPSARRSRMGKVQATQREALAEAMRQVRPGTRKHELLTAVIRAAGHGATDDELEEILCRPHQAISAVRNALMNEGFIVDSGDRRQTRYGHPAIVWVAADAPAAVEHATLDRPLARSG
jgi:hypothetical protein